jgi:nucleoid-associated protein EbfC
MKFDLQGMMAQAQKVQQEMERIKIEVNQKTVEAESGGGMVKCVMTGANQLISLKISSELVNPEDCEMLEDLVIAAVNKAVRDAQDMVSAEMSKVTGMLPNIPGMDLKF